MRRRRGCGERKRWRKREQGKHRHMLTFPSIHWTWTCDARTYRSQRNLFCYTCLKPIWIANFGLINSFRLNPQYILWIVEGGDGSRGGCFKTFSHVFSSPYSKAFLSVSAFVRFFSLFFLPYYPKGGGASPIALSSGL